MFRRTLPNGTSRRPMSDKRSALFVQGLVAMVFLLVAVGSAESPPTMQPSPEIKEHVMAAGGLQVAAGEHAVLVDNIGTYGRKISTQSAIAQKFFDQGLRLTFGYYFPEAIASFEEAQQYDPDHPMLDWGLAFAMGPNPNSRKTNFPDDPHDDGKKAIARARTHQPSAR